MTCEQIEVWISAAQDGELDPRRQSVVEDHLATCAGCRELAAEWSALERTLRSELVRCDAPETLHTRVMRQIPEPAAAPVGRRGSWTPGGWFSFGLVPVGAAAAWMLLAGNPSVKPPPTVPATNPVSMAAGTADPTSAMGTDSNASVTIATAKPLVGSSGVRNTVSGPKGAGGGSKEPAKSGPSRGTRQKYDSIRSLRGLRQRRKSYKLARGEWRRSRRWRPDRRHDEPLRMVTNSAASRPQVPPRTTNEAPTRMVQMPRVTVVDYVLPQVPAPTTPTDGGTDTQFVLRSAQPQEVAQAGYEF
jgi:hypothetical protein